MLTSTILHDKKAVIEAIENDEEFGLLYKYLKNPEAEYPADKQILENRAADYIIIDDLLFYQRRKNSFGELRPVIPKSLRPAVLKELHDIPTAGHLGIRKTIARAMATVFWPNMRNEIYEYVRSCISCQKNNYINVKPAGTLKSIETSFPNEVVSVDLLGPYPRSTSGQFSYILVIIDNFSRWTELVPLKNASAQNVANALLNKYILKYGSPLKIISDNGPQFVSSVFKHLCTALDIQHFRTVPYRPQSNMAERANRNVVMMIRSFIDRNHRSWDLHLEKLAFALRTARNDSTQFTPAELFLGRKIITPLDKLFFVKQRGEEFKLKDMTEILQQANKNITKAQSSYAKYYNLRRRPHSFQRGQKILKSTHPISSASENYTAKFAAKFDGPYTITDVRGDNLKISNETEELTINADQARPYYQRQTISSTEPQPSTSKQSKKRYNKHTRPSAETAYTAKSATRPCNKKPPMHTRNNKNKAAKDSKHSAAGARQKAQPQTVTHKNANVEKSKSKPKIIQTPIPTAGKSNLKRRAENSTTPAKHVRFDLKRKANEIPLPQRRLPKRRNATDWNCPNTRQNRRRRQAQRKTSAGQSFALPYKRPQGFREEQSKRARLSRKRNIEEVWPEKQADIIKKNRVQCIKAQSPKSNGRKNSHTRPAVTPSPNENQARRRPMSKDKKLC